MMKEGTKNTLKFLFAMLILVFVVDIVIAEDPAERKAYFMVLLLIIGLVSVFLLLRKFYTVRINQQRDRELPKYKQPQSVRQDGPPAAGAWVTAAGAIGIDFNGFPWFIHGSGISSSAPRIPSYQ